MEVKIGFFMSLMVFLTTLRFWVPRAFAKPVLTFDFISDTRFRFVAIYAVSDVIEGCFVNIPLSDALSSSSKWFAC